jgi:protein-tyrosine phosphatase
MGLRVAIDLRSERERHAEPCGLPWLRTLAVPLIQERAAGATRPEVRPDDGAQFLAELYRDILTESATQLGDVLRALGAVDGVPAVVHCSAGKDRTGMVIAVLLTVLGVDEETVLDDYVLSSRYRSEQRVAELIASLGDSGIPAGLAAGLMGTPRWAMAEALASVRPQFGGMDSYLADAAGLQRWEIERLREQLLTG